MIDYKIGENENKSQINENTFEANLLNQIQYLRNYIIRKSEKAEQQRMYTNIILTIIAILIGVLIIPVWFKIGIITTALY